MESLNPLFWEPDDMWAVDHPNVTAISAANAPRHPCNLKFIKAVSWVIRKCRGQHKPAKEVGGTPLSEGMEEVPVHLSGDGGLLLKVVKCPTSSKVAQSAKQEQLHWRRRVWAIVFWLCPLFKCFAFFDQVKEGQKGGMLHPEPVAELEVKPLVLEIWCRNAICEPL